MRIVPINPQMRVRLNDHAVFLEPDGSRTDAAPGEMGTATGYVGRRVSVRFDRDTNGSERIVPMKILDVLKSVRDPEYKFPDAGTHTCERCGVVVNTGTDMDAAVTAMITHRHTEECQAHEPSPTM